MYGEVSAMLVKRAALRNAEVLQFQKQFGYHSFVTFLLEKP